MIRLLIVDDHPVVRAGFRHLVEHEPDIQIGGEADTGQSALEQSRADGWQLVVLDLGLPDTHGLHVLHQLKEDAPDRPVLAVSTRRDPDLAVRAMQLGAAGFLPKDSSTDEILGAIRTIGSTGSYVNDWLASQLSGGANSGAPHERLSGREEQVFMLLASGRRSKDIAAELNLSVKTVSTYRSRVLEKLRLSTNAELGVYAVRHGLLTGGAPAAPDTDDYPARPR